MVSLAALKIRSTKPEILNKHEGTKSESQKRRWTATVWNICISHFGFVSYFEIRVSDFYAVLAVLRRLGHASMPISTTRQTSTAASASHHQKF